MKTIDIIGFDGRSWSAESLELLRNADLVAAGERVLAALPPEPSAPEVPPGRGPPRRGGGPPGGFGEGLHPAPPPAGGLFPLLIRRPPL